jgi:WD40 repeat protein
MTGGSLCLMIVLFASQIQHGHTLFGFWLTMVALLVSCACVCIPAPKQEEWETKEAPSALDTLPMHRLMSRRSLLALNLAGLLGVGGAGIFLDIFFTTLSTRVHAFHSTLPVGGYKHVFGYNSHILDWSPDSAYLAEAIDGRGLNVWHVATTRQAFTCPLPQDFLPDSYDNSFTGVAWSPDGRFLAGVLYPVSHGALCLWDAHTGAFLRRFPEPSVDVTGVSWSPDGTRLAVGGDKMTILDAASTKILATYTMPDEQFLFAMLLWSPNGRMIAGVNRDTGVSTPATVYVWDSQTGEHRFSYTTDKNAFVNIGDIAWSPDSTRLAVGLQEQTSENPPQDVVPLPVVIFDVRTGKQVLSCQGHLGGSICVSWSPDGTHLASGGADRTVQIWNTTTGVHLLTYQKHVSWVMGVAWSPDGKSLASVDWDGPLYIWDAAPLAE